MKKRFIITLIPILSYIIIITPAYSKNVERVMNIDDSIYTGLNNNQELLILKEQVLLAKQRVSESRALIYPRIDFNFNASQFENDVPIVLSPSFDNIYLPARSNQNYSTRFSLWQYLYSAGRYTNNLRLAQTNLSRAESKAEVVKNDVIREVKKEFYNLTAIKEKIEAYDNTIKNIEKSSNQKSDITKEKLRFELNTLKHEYKKEHLHFLRIIGLELNTDIEINGALEPPKEKYDLNKCLAWAFQYRSELRQTQYQEAMDTLRVNLSMAERYPTITMGASYEWLGDQFPLNNRNWNATINLNVPVFDGWASWSRIKQRRIQAREGRIQRARIEDKIRIEVREALLDYDFWMEQLKIETLDPKNYKTLSKDKKLELEILKIETVKNALMSQFDLEWAIGKYLAESSHFVPTQSK